MKAHQTTEEENLCHTKKSKGIQTTYRDSEVQTSPFSPKYIINLGENPEILTLASLKMGNGLPAGVHEIEMIERARKRREIENGLAPLSTIIHDKKKMKDRRKILDLLEVEEWSYREKEIDEKRENTQMALDQRRLDNIWQYQKKVEEEQQRNINHNLARQLRKLIKKREKFSLTRKRNIIDEYANPGSQSFAPLTRIGQFVDRYSEKYTVKSVYLKDYNGLLELESYVNRKYMDVKLNYKPKEMFTKKGYPKRAMRRQMNLAELHEYFKRLRQAPEVKPTTCSLLRKIEKPPARPSTPSYEIPNEYIEDKVTSAVLLMQNLIRGRATQAMLFEGKEKRLDIIKELRSTHALLDDELREQDRLKMQIKSFQAEQENVIDIQNKVNAELNGVESEILADMLEFLSKELSRLLEERRLHALAMRAERERRLREAEESGRRQKEERRRREHDEMFKQMVKTHQLSVDSYLGMLCGEEIEASADLAARQHMAKVASDVNEASHRHENTRTELSSNELAAALVHQFLIPHVEREHLKDTEKAKRARYLKAAHEEIIANSEQLHPHVTKSREDTSNASVNTDQ